MRYKKIDSRLFTRNREKLANKISDKSFLIIFSNEQQIRSADQFFSYRQNSDLIYFTGLQQEKTIFTLHKDGDFITETIFIIHPDEKQLVWQGHKYTQEEASEISGILNVMYEDHFEEYLQNISGIQNLYLCNYNPESAKNFPPNEKQKSVSELLFKKVSKIENATPILTELRLVKEKEELQQIRKAVEITKSGFETVCRNLLPGMKEFEVEAFLNYEFTRNGACHAYEPIVASGENACVLHYNFNDKVCKKGELLLLDFGAEYANYASDCSRTIPVNGNFSKRQKDCYSAVLRVFKEARKLMVPGTTINKINEQVGNMMTEEMIGLKLFTKAELKKQNPEMPLYKKYYMHGTSHFMGLDVHDVGGKDVVLQKGMVLTCEPGLYIREEKIGIRIENDILVDKKPIDLMEKIPIEIADIENLLKK